MAGAGLPGRVPVAFMAATSSLVAKRPLMRGRTSAYALRLWYRIVFSNVRRFRFSRYLHTVSRAHETILYSLCTLSIVAHRPHVALLSCMSTDRPASLLKAGTFSCAL